MRIAFLLATRDGVDIFYQPVEKNYNSPDDPEWYKYIENWPQDPEQAAAAVNGLIAKRASTTAIVRPTNRFRIAIGIAILASSVSNNFEASVGRITSATNNDDVSVMINVSGKNFINSPTIPGQNAMGANAPRVVAVDAMIGIATSAVAYFAECTRSNPFSRKR